MIFPRQRRHKGGSIVGALVMLVIGCIFLAGMTLPGWSLGNAFARGWPFILIAVGFGSLLTNIVQAPFRGRLDLMGPIVLMTVGGLFALDNFIGLGFHRTWPVLLIVIAIGIVLKKILMLPLLPLFRRRL